MNIPVLLSVSVLAVASMSANGASAQTAVIDSANLQQNTQTAAQAASAVQQLQASLTQLQQTYSMFTTVTNTGAMAPGLDNPALENPMPPAATMLAQVNGQPSATQEAAGITAPADINERAITNIQNMAATNLAAIEQRLAQLPQLEADIASATSITQLVAVDAKIALQSQFVEAQEAQAANLQVLAFEQAQSHMQQAEDEHAQESAGLAAQYGAAAGK